MRTALIVVALATSILGQSDPGVSRPAAATADTAVYCVIPVQELHLLEGTLPVVPESARFKRYRPLPYAVLDGAGVAYYVPADDRSFAGSDPGRIAIRLDELRTVTGRLFVEGAEGTLVERRFGVGFADFSADHRQDFLLAARDRYLALLRAGRAGAAWWRHRATLFSELAGYLQLPDEMGRNRQRGSGAPRSNMDDTFELFSGSRAVAENVQLDRTLPATPADAAELVRDTDELQGITLAEYDWTQAVTGPPPALDLLSALVPADQHAVFFASFSALVELSDRADEQGTGVLQMIAEATGEAGTKARYQRQLGLEMSELARLLGPQLIVSVVLTGGDPYLATGSDVALLFQAKDVEVLLPLILARVAASTADEPEVETRTGSIGGIDYSARVSPGRDVCSYVFRLRDAVVVTNSEAQVSRLAAVADGAAPDLGSQPEYAFFRSRYPLGDPAETALIVVSDATIRRWCGPRWRIGDSRRTRAAAALSESQARLIESQLAGGGGAGPVEAVQGVGAVTVVRGRVLSALYGSLAFMTPIAELDLDRVSSEEVDLYGRWRDGYQRNWSGTFDPIGVRLGVSGPKASADLTVRPLILGSDYRDYIDLAGGSKIAPQDCDPHAEVLAQWIMALDPRAPLLGEQASMLSMLMPEVDALGWLGRSVSIYVDDDPFWDELAASEDGEEFLERHWPRLPIALHAEVGNGLLLTAFLVGLRGVIEQSSPGMTIWENHRHRDQPYVSIRQSPAAIEESRDTLGEGVATPAEATVYYAASGDGLIVTLSEPLIQRALDRRLARQARAAAEAGTPAPADVPRFEPQPDWLGEHLGLRIKGEAIDLLTHVLGETQLDSMRAAAFWNLPILNEWHRLFPGEDPVAVHERLWHRRLLCPGGGTYRWNEAWQTMESSVYGHPGEPRDGPTWPPAVERIVEAAAGLTFEGDGLRARLELQTK